MRANEENRSVRPTAARRSVEAADDVGTRRRMMSAFCRILFPRTALLCAPRDDAHSQSWPRHEEREKAGRFRPCHEKVMRGEKKSHNPKSVDCHLTSSACGHQTGGVPRLSAARDCSWS